MHFAYMWAVKACFTVNLQPKYSWREFSPHLVTLTLFGHFRQKELLLIKFTHPLTLLGLGRRGSDAWMTNSNLPFRNFLFYV